MIPSKEVLQKARQGHYAIPAANFIDSLTAEAYVQCAEERHLPLILAYAQSHSDFLPLEEAAAIGNYLKRKASTTVILHFDHGMEEAFLYRAMDLGFDSVMMDASEDSFESNISRTKAIVKEAHSRNLMVESELGHVGTNHGKDSIYTEARDVLRFVEETDVDSLAISIGTSHGVYRGVPHINLERLDEIAQVTELPLVLHGGSSSGDDNLSECAQRGISKINIYTDFVLAAVRALKEGFYEDYSGAQKSIRKAIIRVLNHYYDVFHTERAHVSWKRSESEERSGREEES